MWFLTLSGWAPWLAVVAAAVAFTAIATVGLTWMGNRSVVRNALLVAMIVGAIGFAMLAIAAWVSRV